MQIVADMDELEQQRKQDFKQYEMKKKAEEDHKMVLSVPYFYNGFEQTEKIQFFRTLLYPFL